MDIDVIKAAIGIDHDLGRLATSLVDEELRERVLAVQSNWRDLAYTISATVCGVAMKNLPEPAKKRGRPKKTEHDDPARMPSHEDSVSTADNITSGGAAQI